MKLTSHLHLVLTFTFPLAQFVRMREQSLYTVLLPVNLHAWDETKAYRFAMSSRYANAVVPRSVFIWPSGPVAIYSFPSYCLCRLATSSLSRFPGSIHPPGFRPSSENLPTLVVRVPRW